jgi:hypothetical protein
MNCANHPDLERTAFCQNCGKPICADCTRTTGTSVYCEQCLAARTNASAPPAGFPYPGYPYPGYSSPGYTSPGRPAAPGEPNPGLAALLGFIPGVGAMYNEQYGKGIIHLAVFATLVVVAHDVSGVFGIFIAGWIFYMVIEAHHTARARRDGTPLPNPFGLNDLSIDQLGFNRGWHAGPPPPAGSNPAGATPPDHGAPPANPYASPYSPPYSPPYVPPAAQWGSPYGYGAPPVPPVPPVPPMPPFPDGKIPNYRRFPAGAIGLIVLGLFFLFGDSSWFHFFPRHLFGPFLVIGVGVWSFVRKMTGTGPGLENDPTPMYRWRLRSAIRSSFWVVLTGFIWLLDELHILSWSHSWPIFLIAGGAMMVIRHAVDWGYDYAPPFPGPPPAPVAPSVASTGLVPSNPAPRDPAPSGPSSDQEGR